MNETSPILAGQFLDALLDANRALQSWYSLNQRIPRVDLDGINDSMMALIGKVREIADELKGSAPESSV